MPSTAGYTLLRSVKITSLSTLVDDTNNVYTYTDSYSDAYQFYNGTGTDVEVGDRIILLDSQDYYLMKAAEYANTYVGSEGGMDEVVAFTVSTGGAVSNTLAAATNTDSLTDSSGGTANTTIAAITNAANVGSADVGPVADGFADIAAQLAKQRTLNTVLINAITSLGTKVNQILAANP